MYCGKARWCEILLPPLLWIAAFLVNFLFRLAFLAIWGALIAYIVVGSI